MSSSRIDRHDFDRVNGYSSVCIVCQIFSGTRMIFCSITLISRITTGSVLLLLARIAHLNLID